MGTKFGIVIGLGAGYVLGTRAGRERYNQIKKQWLKVWNQPVVQDRVSDAKKFAADKTFALPKQLGTTLVNVVKSATQPGTAGQKLDAATATAKNAEPAVKRAAKTTAKAVADRADDLADAVEDAADEISDAIEDTVKQAKKTAARKPAATKPTAKK